MRAFYLVRSSVVHPLLTVTALALMVSACGQPSSESPQASQTQTGRFIDSPVQGLLYKTTSGSGQTDAGGYFGFRDGDSVRFSLLPDLALADAAIPAKSLLTPRHVFPGAGASDRRVINLARVLQSLDADQNTRNGIDLRLAQRELESRTGAARVAALSLDVAPDDLAAANPQLMAYLQDKSWPLVSETVAARHLECSEQDMQKGQEPDGQCAVEPVADEVTVSPKSAAVSVPEGQANHREQFELVLSAASDKVVSVHFETLADTAMAGGDFVATSGTATFPVGTMSQNIAVVIVGDTVTEASEHFRLVLSAPQNASISGDSIDITILDDDTAPDPGTPAEPANVGYGGGIIGAFAQFAANFNKAIVAFFNGDFEGAMSAGQAAFSDFGSDMSDVFTGSDGPATTLSESGAAGDPQSMFNRFLAGIGRLIGLQSDPQTAAMALRPARAAEVIVMTGAQLPGWSAPAARGQGYPYPSGANISGQSDQTEPLAALAAIRDPLKVGEVRDAHNGQMIYPAAGQVIPLGVPVDEVAAYKWTGTSFEEIPVQVDEKYPFFLANAGSSFSIYSGTDPELTYAWDRENWDARDAANDPCTAAYPAGKPDPVASLDDDDEVVFMASDAGTMAPMGDKPAKATQVQMVRLQDAADPQAERVVYVVRQAGGSSFRNKPTYVRYQRNANADQWIDRTFFADGDPEQLGSSNTNYGPNRKGTVCLDGKTAKPSTDRFPRDGLVVETDTYRWEASGRWMIRDIRIKVPGVAKPDWAQIKSTRPDLLDRWKGRAFQQSPDSTVSLVGFEDEQVNWEANSSLLGERCGPVRCIREVWGADSGTNVTKTETFYRDAVSYRYRIRVHPIPPDGLYTSWDYNRSAMLPTAAERANGVEPGRYFTALRPQGVPVDGVNDDIGQIDSVAPIGGQCMTSDGPKPPDAKGRCPLFLDAADPTFNLPLAFNNWEQISGKGNSGALVYTFALKGATSLANPLVVPYYRDDACLDDGTGDDPVQRPWPGESSADARVIAAYASNDAIARGGNGNGKVDCEEQQGVYGANGIHYFATHDSDNAFAPVTATEVDGEQWQFMVPAAQPRNVGDAYANIIRAPLQVIAVPLTPPSP